MCQQLSAAARYCDLFGCVISCLLLKNIVISSDVSSVVYCCKYIVLFFAWMHQQMSAVIWFLPFKDATAVVCWCICLFFVGCVSNCLLLNSIVICLDVSAIACCWMVLWFVRVSPQLLAVEWYCDLFGCVSNCLLWNGIVICSDASAIVCCCMAPHFIKMPRNRFKLLGYKYVSSVLWRVGLC